MKEKDTDGKPHELEQAAADWQPDSAKNAPLNPEGGNDYVSLIDDPFGIRTLEIGEAQQNPNELELDEPAAAADGADDAELGPEAVFEKDAGELENLARAIEVEAKKLETQALANDAEQTERSEEELARQIAEDQRLAAELAREAAEAEKAFESDPELLAALPREPRPDAQGKLDLSELESCIETLLFMSDKPVAQKKLREWLGPGFGDDLFAQALQGLQARYQASHHGVELVEVAGAWQLRTKPGRAALAKRLSKVQTQRLSTGGMESLAIIAYRQPVMKEEIDKIRGVDSSYFIRGLLDKKLISISGRSELPGRPMLYSTTEHFLELFGLKDLAAMPSLRELEQMVPASQSKNPDDEDPRVREMRKLVGKMNGDTSTSLLYDPKEDEALLREIRERVQSIPVSTPYLDEQKALEKAAKQAASAPPPADEAGQLPLDAADAAVADAPATSPTEPEPIPEP